MSKTYITSGNPQADQRYAMAEQFWKRGDSDAAIDILRQTQALVPAWAPLPFRIAEILTASGRPEDSIRAYKEYLALEPADTLGAAVKIALLEKSTPPQMSGAYIETLFDDYAPRFDHSLVKKLEYRTPRMLAEMLHPAMPGERILDLGCGTGLSGEALLARGARIDGVDISAGMLAEAEKKAFYFSLTQSDIFAFLKTVREPYDIIIAADVLVYIGALEELFVLAARALKSGAQFAFSVQAGRSGFTLGADHRYAHGNDYVEACLKKAGLQIIKQSDAVLRKDGGMDIQGRLYVTTR